MTHAPRTQAQAAPPQALVPFADDPTRWQALTDRALAAGHTWCGEACSTTCELVLIRDRTRWGFADWSVPDDGGRPEQPHRIGVFAPVVSRTQRLALRWLIRRPPQRLQLPLVRSGVRWTTAFTAALSLLCAPLAYLLGMPAGVVAPLALLAPLLVDYLPERLDARAGEHVRIVEDEAACRYLQRLAALQSGLVQAADGRDRYELHRSAEIGQHLLWDAADLLQTQDTRTVSAELLARERLMLQLADQVAQILQRASAEDGPADADQAGNPGRPPAPSPHGGQQPTRPAPHFTPGTSPLKGHTLMPQPCPADRTADIYLLFAHEPYYPGPGTQEINTTLVAAASLLHPRVQQPDGAQIHDRLTRGRQPGEIVPLATLTHELDGGADWPTVGDWERVTTDLLQLVRDADCDALSLGLPEIARALICTGPHGRIRAFDAAADEVIVYGPAERSAVLAEVDTFLTCHVAEQDLWPGDGLLPARTDHA